MFIPKTDISIAEPIGVQIDELGNDTTQMYQLIGIINDEKVGCLESLLNYVNEELFSKDDPAINNTAITLRINNTTKRPITYTIQITQNI